MACKVFKNRFMVTNMDTLLGEQKDIVTTSRVSVIIPVFNNQEGIKTCLDVLRNQVYPAGCFEAVVVDNGSTSAIRIDESYPFHVRLERCEVPGSYAARNVGARMATGEILAFTDADCVPCSEWIDRGVQAILTGKGQRIVGGEVKITEPHLRSGVALYQHATGFHQQANVERKGFSATANVFCTMEQFQTIGPFDERLFSGGDREWAWRAIRRGLTVVFEQRAIVSTPPRTTLRSAIRQARRVAAGRHYLRKYGLGYLGPKAIAPHRSLWESFYWILTRQQFSYLERLKVLYAAVIIKTTTVIETARLRLGGKAERR